MYEMDQLHFKELRVNFESRWWSGLARLTEIDVSFLGVQAYKFYRFLILTLIHL